MELVEPEFSGAELDGGPVERVLSGTEVGGVPVLSVLELSGGPVDMPPFELLPGVVDTGDPIGWPGEPEPLLVEFEPELEFERAVIPGNARLITS